MKKARELSIRNLLAVVIAFFFMISASDALAHCDTMEGPVVAEARQALVTGDVTPLLKWVSSDEEETIKTAFKHTLAVRQLGGEAKTLADMYFFETLVRIHRAGEGAPYTGLKSGISVDPAVALADAAIATGSVDKLSDVLSNALKNGLTDRFNQVIISSKHAGESVEAGREYVEAYVQFTHFAEGVHGMIKGEKQHAAHN
ncbi:hypothetical protein FCL47_17235 [Desulfopila sp. IMCC35006]|uniref:DUF6448 family protein n=1 Tax=Desulfopila sp. IMCC35006 TaxID=2569542 RepID=UPI0010AD82FC|nr:DUF6448 family protein [Desulfopila sp. IMCC35006]TKB24581.1 hypothetical protein FCL47_17235 [Desulfopila sp. IMCC35006]